MAWYVAVIVVLLALALAYDLYARYGALRKERALARTDELTRVDNRRAFSEAAGREFERARRYGHPLTLAYFDVDDFKEVNDRFGHQVGDNMLRLVAQTARSSIRATDIVARLGGDEFALLLPETGPEAAGAVIQKVRQAFREASQRTGLPRTISGGAVTYLQPAGSLESAIGSADQLLYAAKRAGKDTFSYEVVAPQATEGFEPARLRQPFRLPPSFEAFVRPPPPRQRPG